MFSDRYFYRSCKYRQIYTISDEKTGFDRYSVILVMEQDLTDIHHVR